MGNYVDVGVSYSGLDDSYVAAKEAAEAALTQLKGKKPILTFVFFSGEHDVERLNEGLLEILDGTEFIGGSTDAVIFKDKIYPHGIVVASIYSDYMHVGIASIDGIASNTAKKAGKTIQTAVSNISMDRYTDSYMAFKRVKKGNLAEMIKMPSFFVFALSRGWKNGIVGNEDLIIEGIGKKIGYYIPVFGGSLGSKMENVFNHVPYEIYSLHSGKIMKDALVTAFVSTDLKYSNSISHGAKPTGKVGHITEVIDDGFIVTEIDNKPINKWYAEAVGVSYKEFMKNQFMYTQKYQLGFPDGYGNLIMRAGQIPAKGGLYYIAPMKKDTPVVLMDLSQPKKLMCANKEIFTDMKDYLARNLASEMNFLVSCCSRRRILDSKSFGKELKELNKKAKAPLFGFSSFGEIGSKPAQACHFHHMCTNVFSLYDKFLSD